MKKQSKPVVRFLFSGGVKTNLRRWLWELPQSILGLLLSSLFAIRGKIRYAEEAEGVLVIVTDGRWGGISLGNIIIGSSSISPVVGNQLFMHEYGHSIQSRAVGPLYLIIYGLPSLLSVIFKGSNHHESYVEKYANKLAFRYFQNKYLLEQWDIRNYPIT